MIDAQKTVKGTWSQSANKLTITFQNCIYEATIQGKSMSGNAHFTTDYRTWAFALTNAGATPPTADAGVAVSLPNRRFEVRFPSAPQASNKEVSLPHGSGKATQWDWKLSKGNTSLEFYFFENPAGYFIDSAGVREKLNRFAATRLAPMKPSRVNYDRELLVGQLHPGRDVEWELADGRLCRCRVVATAAGIYELFAFGPGEFVLGADAGSFIASFRTSDAPMTSGPVSSVAGTTWIGTESLSGFGALTFEFQGDGRAVMIDAQATTNGNWSQTGAPVTITFQNCVYIGRIQGNVLSGNAKYTVGEPRDWTFSVTRSQGSSTTSRQSSVKEDAPSSVARSFKAPHGFMAAWPAQLPTEEAAARQMLKEELNRIYAPTVAILTVTEQLEQDRRDLFVSKINLNELWKRNDPSYTAQLKAFEEKRMEYARGVVRANDEMDGLRAPGSIR